MVKKKFRFCRRFAGDSCLLTVSILAGYVLAIDYHLTCYPAGYLGYAPN
jgi:hypothetical protein